ncbi:MAG: helix-turn-helix domain-containing protein [SAR324 cluster bacterium]|nr:helix-turn-helix domain-containing protein [SAR324 cluster bacterium]
MDGLLRALELWSHKNNPKIQLFSVKEVAELLGCSPRTIKGLIHDKKELRYLTVGREIKIRHQDIEFFIKQRLRLSVYDQGILK